MEFYRGLILVSPHGSYVKNGSKTLIIKSLKLKDIDHKPLLLIENKKGLGIIYLDKPKKISLDEFKKKYKKHIITEKERLEWWKGKRNLYEYKIIKKKFFKIPLNLNYKTGPQVLVKPDNIWIIHPKKYYIGTSGYQYEFWDKVFYPENLEKNTELDYYSQKFNSVEINYTFYRVPSLSAWEKWSKINNNFKYSVKMNRSFIYSNKLDRKRFNSFMEGLQILDSNNKMGCLLIQYRKNIKNNDHNFKKVENLLKNIRSKNKNIKIAFEFRDSSWFNNYNQNIYKLMKKYNCTIAIIHVNNRNNWAGDLESGFNPNLNDFRKTTNYVYIRMHGETGQYTGSYNTKTLKELTTFLEKINTKYAYVYFNNTDSLNKYGHNKLMPSAILDANKLQKMIK